MIEEGKPQTRINSVPQKESTAPFEAQQGKYIYCIIQKNRGKDLDLAGINNQKIILLPYKDITAVVSDSPIIKFNQLDKRDLTDYVTIHQKVNEQLIKEYDVVPMAFGIIAPSIDEVSRILERAYLQFKSAFRKIAGKVEFAVQVWWDQKKLLEELVNTNLEIQKLKQEISLKKGILALPLKIKLGKLIQQAVETSRQTFIHDIQTFLNNVSFDFTLNKLIEDDIIANFSFLIEKAKEPELDKKMQELGKKYEGKLRFKYIGPMPAYSFVNINLSVGNFELIDEARKLLGLEEETEFEQIKKAYYSLSHQYHPDKRQDNLDEAQEHRFDPSAGSGQAGRAARMKKIIQAYSILESYCQNCDDTRNNADLTRINAEGYAEQYGKRKYSFKKQDVENLLIVK